MFADAIWLSLFTGFSVVLAIARSRYWATASAMCAYMWAESLLRRHNLPANVNAPVAAMSILFGLASVVLVLRDIVRDVGAYRERYRIARLGRRQ